MSESIAAWLTTLGLERYTEPFGAADIGADVLPDLSDGDLEKLGVTLGDRKRLLRAIAADEARRSTAAPHDRPGERRQLTVLFCDLVGSTALAARLDPEDLRAVITAYHTCCAEIVAAHGGEVSQFLGDGVMFQFGYPRAHEDDPERAVCCALALIGSVRELALPSGMRLRARIGIATGTEVVGDLTGASSDRASVVGNTPNLASRLQSMAEPDSVVIASPTRRLLGDAFALTPLGSRAVKGIDEPLKLWRVDGEKLVTSRFAARQTKSSACFVGRESELALIRDRWHLARNGEGQVVLLSADAGVGKSRIVEAFLERTHPGERFVIRLQCFPRYSTSALHPVRSFIEHTAGIASADTTGERFAKLEALNARLLQPLPAFVDVLALLLALPGAGELPPIFALTVDQRKALIFSALLECVAALARSRPVAFVVEDLHWVDPTTLELVTRMIDVVRHQRVFVIATARHEFVSPWINRGDVTALALNRLERGSVERMINELCGGKALPETIFAQIVERTDGVPLFVEELTKAVLESRAVEERSDRFALADERVSVIVPETLRDALAARLDTLASVRDVAAVGAVIGREFSADLLAVVSGRDGATLHAALERLVGSGLVLQHTTATGSGYSFKHALVRDAAYESLLRPRRQHFHLEAAKAIVARFAARAEAEPEIVAQHFEEGGEPALAMPYWQRAADLAISGSAYREAASHLRRALDLLPHVAADRETSEFELCNRLGIVYCVLEGGRSQNARVMYERAWSLAANYPDTQGSFQALWGLCYCDYMSGRIPSAHKRSAELIALGERLGDPSLMLEALHANWGVAFCIGDITRVLATTAQGSEIYDPVRHHQHVTTFGVNHDSGICVLGHGAMALVIAGRIDEGRRWIERTEALIARLDHPFSEVSGYIFITLARDLLGEYDRVIAIASDGLERAIELNFTMPKAMFSLFIAGARVSRDGDPAATSALRNVLDEPESGIIVNWKLMHLAKLALAEFAEGDEAAAVERLEQAERTSREVGGCVGESEIDRAWAVIFAARGDDEAAQNRLRAAADLARLQGASLFELRVEIDRLRYAKRRADVERTAEARVRIETLLDDIAGGDDALDVRRARAVLDEEGRHSAGSGTPVAR